MYKVTLTFLNPITGDSDSSLIFQFDPATLDQTKWSGAYPTVKAKLDALVSSSTPKEPPIW